MKLITTRNNIKKGLSVIERITGRNISLPILNNVLIKSENNFLTLIGTDLEIGIIFWSLAKIETEGDITIPSKLLYGLISTTTEEKIKLETKNNILYISGEKYKAQVNGLSSEEFPIIPKIKNKSEFIEVNNIPILKGLTKVLSFCSTGQSYPELSGVYFKFQKDKLEIVSTDSFRLAKIDLYFEKKMEKNYSFILPQKAVREITNILSEKSASGKGNNKTKIYIESNQIFFEIMSEDFSFPEFQLASRLIEGEYPNYQEIIPTSYKTQILLNKNDFINNIKAAALFSGKVNRIDFKINPGQNLIELSSQSAEAGEIKSSIQAEIKGEKTEVSFNFRFLMEGLSNMEGQKVSLELNGQEGPALLKSEEDPDYLYIIMPVKS
jgi:DNA polymerase III subunit beta